ncbi:phage holin family protein [Pseudotabrizicola sp. 4114]|uniref:phage holin family protein n=1 Tax=Pseudotabrizicola sp. 4114 TaxID=2817731 RepID=UPI002865C3D8|nr:putative benzoate:H+ symporter BenE [Pseudorhodobacter sp. 4114]
MTDPDTGLVGALQALLGGAATTLFAATLGRLVYHGGEVRAGRRPLFGWHLIWEVPTAVVMALVAESLATYMGLSPQVTTGVVAVLAYLGPRGARDVVDRVVFKPKG